MTKEARLNGGSNLNPDVDLESLKVRNEIQPLNYKDDIAELGLSDEQAVEFLGILFSIMCSFVEMGFKFDVSAYLEDQANANRKNNLVNDDKMAGRE